MAADSRHGRFRSWDNRSAIPQQPFTYADYCGWPAYERAGVREVWLIHPADRVVSVYTPNPDGGYGKPAIHETTGTLAPGLFPDLLIEWELVFSDTTAQPSSPPTKDLS